MPGTFHAENADHSLLAKFMKSVGKTNESRETHDYLNMLIQKPWGIEYRVYVDDFFDVWHLIIKPLQSTSMHCHPRKATLLYCLDGTGVTTLANGENVQLHAGKTIYLRRGVFHSTSSGANGLQLIEVENPRDKFDLLRASDTYGRATQNYEPEGEWAQNLPPMVEEHNYFIRYRDINKKYFFSVSGRDVQCRSSRQGPTLLEVSVDFKQHLLGDILVRGRPCKARVPPSDLRWLKIEGAPEAAATADARPAATVST